MWISLVLERIAGVVGLAASSTRQLAGRKVTMRRRLPALPRAGRGAMRVVYTEAVVHESFSRRSQLVRRGARLVLRPFLRMAPVNDRTIMLLRGLDRLQARRPRSRYVEPVRFELGGVPVESMTHRYGPTSDLTVLYLHGGGFLSCGIDSHRRLCERLALRTGATVISVDYVQLPDGTVADSVQDAIGAYTALVKSSAHPDKIVVAGDSAGGYLAMKIAELASRRRLPRPAAILGFSPLLSLDPDSIDKGIEQVVRFDDAYLPLRKIARIRPRWMPESAVMEGELSPLDATRWISSPTFMTVTEDEILRPEVEAMALALVGRGVPVDLHIWRKQVHAFPVLANAIPEGDLAIRLAADFARRAVGELQAEPFRDPHGHQELLDGIAPGAA